MNTPKKQKRTKEIKIRLTEQEHQILLDKKTGAELATWIRDTCLEVKNPKRKTIKTADPKLLLQLARIGSNLNQIAKTANTQAKADIINVVRLTTELITIREQLNEILERNQ